MAHRQHMQQLMSICTALSTNDRPCIHHRASMDPSKPRRPLRIVFEPGIASVAIVGYEDALNTCRTVAMPAHPARLSNGDPDPFPTPVFEAAQSRNSSRTNTPNGGADFRHPLHSRCTFECHDALRGKSQHSSEQNVVLTREGSARDRRAVELQ